MATSWKQDEAFIDAMIQGDFLRDAIDWIANNLEVEDVFPKEVLDAWAENWAEENGYVLKEE